MTLRAPDEAQGMLLRVHKAGPPLLSCSFQYEHVLCRDSVTREAEQLPALHALRITDGRAEIEACAG